LFQSIPFNIFLPVCCQHYVKKKTLIETFFYGFPHSVPLIAEMQQISFENEEAEYFAAYKNVVTEKPS
jgi:hypothetical protein